ncbi:hypothetical protein ACNOYE_26680 [Nannocystaceae bacterium ST9]
MPIARPSWSTRLIVIGLTLVPAGCMSISPQLHPTDVEALEQLEDRPEREQAYEDNLIYRQKDLRGTRYVKGQRLGARPRSWQSLDAVLRSDRNSAAALPDRPLRVARVLTGLLATSAILMVGGIAASAREGLDLSRLTGTSAILLSGGVLTVGFGIGTGIAYGRARKGYDRAVDIYNDSLGLRLGLYDAEGQYRPPPGVLVDEEGFIILDQRELLIPGTETTPPVPETIEPAPIEPMPFEAPGDPEPMPAGEQPRPPESRASLVGPSRALAGP